jgi:hypothetical protein
MISLAALGISLAAKFIPNLIGSLTGSATAENAAAAIGKAALIATGLSGGDSHDDIAKSVSSLSPEAFAAWQTAATEAAAMVAMEELKTQRTAITEAAVTQRIEVVSNDRFIRYARPFHIWVTGVANMVLVVGMLLAVFFAPEAMSPLISALPHITALLGMSNAVAGVYVWKRSDDKAAAAQAEASSAPSILNMVRLAMKPSQADHPDRPPHKTTSAFPSARD